MFTSKHQSQRKSQNFNVFSVSDSRDGSATVGLYAHCTLLGLMGKTHYFMIIVLTPRLLCLYLVLLVQNILVVAAPWYIVFNKQGVFPSS